MSPTALAVLAGVGTTGAALLARTPRARFVPDGGSSPARTEPDLGLLARHRLACSVLAALACLTLLGGVAAGVLAPVAGATVWATIGRMEPARVRQARAQAQRDLPHLVGLLAAALRSGAAPAEAVRLVGRALPGAAADRLAQVSARLELGGDAASVWATLASDDALGPLGRTMGRAHRSGAPVTTAVDRLADDLARARRAEVEDRARSIGVKAAVPLGLCLLPAFILIGIVPVVAGLITSLGW